MAYTSEIEKLERRVQENPQGRFFASLADAYRKDGQVARALEVVRAGLLIHPDYVSARVVLGRCLLDQGDDAGAEEAFNRVVELDGESVIALKALADIAERRGEMSSAARWSRQLLTVDPGSDEAREQLARVEAAAPTVGADAVTESAPSPFLDLSEPEPPPPAPEPAAPGSPTPEPAAAEPPPAAAIAPDPEPEPAPAPVRASTGIRFEPSADPETRTLELVPPSADAHPPRLSGIELTAVEDEAQPSVASTPGLDLAPPTATDAPAAAPLEGLEATSYDTGPADDGVSLVESAGIGSSEYQEEDASSSLTAYGGASEYQTPSATDSFASSSGPVDVGASEPTGPEVPELPVAAEQAEPEPVVTEAMAVLYANQGHTQEALEVYRALQVRAPDDPRWSARIAELEGTLAPVPAASWLAAETGGASVSGWLQQVMLARLPDVALPPGSGSVTEPAAPAPAPAPAPEASAAAVGATAGHTATRPAVDTPSLGAIFGEEPAAPTAGSFDDFFGGDGAATTDAPVSPRGRTIRHTQVDQEDLSQFQDWLKKLKK